MDATLDFLPQYNIITASNAFFGVFGSDSTSSVNRAETLSLNEGKVPAIPHQAEARQKLEAAINLETGSIRDFQAFIHFLRYVENYLNQYWNVLPAHNKQELVKASQVLSEIFPLKNGSVDYVKLLPLLWDELRHRPLRYLRSLLRYRQQRSETKVDLNQFALQLHSLFDAIQKLAREETFVRLAEQWKREVKHMSLMSDIIAHPAYQEITEMGLEVVPLILTELQTEPDYWFTALRKITGANPVPPEDKGRLHKMTQAWLVWGRQHGYQC